MVKPFRGSFLKPPKVKRSKGLRSKSAKTAARDRRYTAERAMFLDAHGACEIRVDDGCTHWATEVQHKAGRGVTVFFDHSLWLAACHHCHMHVTTHPLEAYERGWSVRRNRIVPPPTQLPEGA